MNRNWLILKSMVSLEAKSYFRSKYLKYSIVHSYLFVPLALFILHGEQSNGLLTVLWICILTATPAIGLSSFGFSKDGYFLLCLVTRNIPLKTYVKAKIVIILIYSMLFYLCLLPFIKLGTPSMLMIFVAGAFYYAGCGGMIMLYCSSFDTHRVNLNSSPLFNYEGFSILKIVLTLPITLPFLVAEQTRHLGVILMLLFGTLGIVVLGFTANFITANIKKRKYSLLSPSTPISN